MIPAAFKPLAWNGVSVTVPSNWDPAELQAFALRAAGDTGPVLELKWKRIQGGFNAEKHLAKVSKGLGGAVTTDPSALPCGWAESAHTLAEQGITPLPYAWDIDGAEQGAGAVLHSEATGCAALAQFVFRDDEDEALARTVLTSFRSHPADGLVPWAAFGIRAQVPGNMELRNFSFNPGHFRLYFTSGKGRNRTELVLDRLGPADVLLGRRTLAQYADTFYGTFGAPDGFFTEDESGDDMVLGALQGSSPLMARLFNKPTFAHARGRMWRAGIGAMLLGVYMRGPNADAMQHFDDVCGSYALVRT